MMAGKTTTFEEGKLILKQLIDNGKAFEKLVELTIAQGGNADYVKFPEKLKIAPYSFEYKAEQNGYIAHLSAMDIGLASVRLGAGRETKDSVIDLGAGIILKKKVGDFVEKGETLALLYASDLSLFDKAKIYLDDAVRYSSCQTDVVELILAVKGG